MRMRPVPNPPTGKRGALPVKGRTFLPNTFGLSGSLVITFGKTASGRTATTSTSTSSELLVGSESRVSEMTSTWFVYVPGSVVSATMLIVADAPAARSPTVQTIVVVPTHAPSEDTNVSPSGSVSVTTTPVAASGPLF